MKTMKIAPKLTFDNLPKTYDDLFFRLHIPRPIRTKAACNKTCKIADMFAGHKLNADQDDYLALLRHLMETCDKKNTP